MRHYRPGQADHEADQDVEYGSFAIITARMHNYATQHEDEFRLFLSNGEVF